MCAGAESQALGTVYRNIVYPCGVCTTCALRCGRYPLPYAPPPHSSFFQAPFPSSSTSSKASCRGNWTGLQLFYVISEGFHLDHLDQLFLFNVIADSILLHIGWS